MVVTSGSSELAFPSELCRSPWHILQAPHDGGYRAHQKSIIGDVQAQCLAKTHAGTTAATVPEKG